jgi:hypothetical protein
MALAHHLHMVTVNPAEFLQIYSTPILAARGNGVVMDNYFLMDLTGTASHGS